MKSFRISVLALCLFTIACNPKYYSPNTLNVPLIEEQGTINLSLAGNTNRGELQVSYGITDLVAAQVNTAFYNREELDANGGSGWMIEGGPGIFLPFGEKWVFESYALFAYGSFENHLPSTQLNYPDTEGNISANLLRFGVQPSIGFVEERFNISLGARIGGLSYTNIEGDLIFAAVDQLGYLTENKSNFLVEPAITARYGGDMAKVQLQLGRSFNVSNPSFKQDFGYMSVGGFFSFGL